MAYYASNEPYQRVDNSSSGGLGGAMLGAGLGAGAVGGWSASGSLAGSKQLNRLNNAMRDKSVAGINKVNSKFSPNSSMINAQERAVSGMHKGGQNAISGNHQLRTKAMGSGGRRAAMYGAGAVGGALLGSL